MIKAYFTCTGCKMAWADIGATVDEIMERNGRAGCVFGCEIESGSRLLLYKVDELGEDGHAIERTS